VGSEGHERNRLMMECKTCGKYIAKSAKICPKCGAKNDSDLGCGCISLIGISILVIILINSCIGV